MRIRLTAPLAALALAWAALVPITGQAALPLAVEGQPLPSLAPMLEQVTPAVVNISTRNHVRVRDPFFDDPFLRRFFGLSRGPRERVEHSLGSGVIVDAAKGHVLTNYHVVQGADEITVTLQDGRDLAATVLGSDPATDLAVLQIPAKDLEELELANSSKLRVGDFVVAVGDPFGLGQTVTSGIVSALQRKGIGHGYQNFIQTDASINPGNSGGALVNLRGELVGINSMIYTPSGGNVGIGFAIPSNLARRVMQQLLDHGSVRRGSLGIAAQDINQRIGRALDVAPGSGVVVTRVRDNSTAAAAGLRAGDVLLALNDTKVGSVEELVNTEGLLPIRKPVKISLLRNGKHIQLSAPLTQPPLDTANGSKLDPRLTGASFSDLDADSRQRGQSGVMVTAVETQSRAAQNGLRQGDLVLAVAQRRVADLRAVRALLDQHPRQLLLTIRRDGRSYYVLMH